MADIQDLIDEGQALVTQRAQLERTLEYICSLMFPTPDRQFKLGGMFNSREATEGWAAGNGISEKMRKIYDNTAVVALERMTAGVCSMVTPDNEKYQEITAGGPFQIELTEDQKRWAEKQRDYLFRVRYDPESGWALAHYNALRSAAALGTGMYLLTERFENQVKIPYITTGLRLSECYLQADLQGNENGFFRYYSASARQLAGVSDYDCSPKVKAWAADPKQSHRLINMMHWIGDGKKVNSNRKWGSWHIEVDQKHACLRSGFTYWPVITYHWNKLGNSPYGEGAAALVLSEVAASNVLAKNALLAAQQHTRPPIAMADDSSMARPNLNPAAINLKAIDAQGRLKIQPLITASNPQLSQIVLDASRQQINVGLYTNLWQVLLDDPKMTATQALIRNNEKGEILSPIGAGVQRGLARLTEAELQILQDKGAWAPGAQLQPPEGLGGRETGSKFASPLDRLRRSRELIGIKSAFELTAEGMAVDPDAADEIDVPKAVRLGSEIAGAPIAIFRDKKEIDARRASRQQQQALAAAAEMAKTAGPGVKGLAEAAQIGSETPAPQGAEDMLAQLGIGTS